MIGNTHCLVNFTAKKIYPIHINVVNVTKTLPQKLKVIDYIISTKTNDSTIEFNGKRFLNQNDKNRFIWLYK